MAYIPMKVLQNISFEQFGIELGRSRKEETRARAREGGRETERER